VRIALLLASLSAGIAAPAAAHITILSPKPRAPANPLVDAPCGPKAPAPRGDVVTVYAPGEQITVQWKETVPHPSHFRVAFDSDGEDFLDPTTLEDVAAAGTELGNGVRVLADAIPERDPFVFNGPPYEQVVTLPEIECENCTLQVIQVATDTPPYGDDNDVYHDCANIALRRAGSASAAPSGAAGGAAGVPAGGVASADSGCAVTGRGARRGGAAALGWATLVLLWARRRRRSRIPEIGRARRRPREA